jgi:hypothetical protein
VTGHNSQNQNHIGTPISPTISSNYYDKDIGALKWRVFDNINSVWSEASPSTNQYHKDVRPNGIWVRGDYFPKASLGLFFRDFIIPDGRSGFDARPFSVSLPANFNRSAIPSGPYSSGLAQLNAWASLGNILTQYSSSGEWYDNSNTSPTLKDFGFKIWTPWGAVLNIGKHPTQYGPNINTLTSN